MANTTKFLDRIMVAFFRRQSPASTRPNPAFMKNTRNAVNSVQAVSVAILSASGVIRGSESLSVVYDGGRFRHVSRLSILWTRGQATSGLFLARGLRFRQWQLIGGQPDEL